MSTAMPPASRILAELLRQLSVLFATRPGPPLLRFEIAALALAQRGAPSLALTELDAALRPLGVRFAGLAALPVGTFAERGTILVRGDRLEPASEEALTAAVAAIVEKVRRPPAKPPPAKLPPARPAPAKPPPAKPPPAKPRPFSVDDDPLASARPASPPPPIALAAAPVVWAPFDAAELARILAAPVSTAAAFHHSLEAHALAAADQFEELLAIGLLRGVEPHAYQLETARRVLRHFRGRALLADEVGLGKTIEAIMVLREYQLRGMARRTLILVPPALVGQWEGELRTKADIEPHVADGDPAIWRREGIVLASQGLARMPRHAALVQEQPWDLVVVDEAHRFKNRSTQAWKLVDGLKSRFLLLLTATPVENDLEELYNLVTLLKPGQLSTLADFKKRHVDPKDPTAARDARRLRDSLAEVMVRNTRANSGLALPPRYVTTVATAPSHEEARMYDAVVALLRTHRESGDARRKADTLMLEAGSSPAAVLASVARFLAAAPDGPLATDLAEIGRRARAADEPAKATALLDILRAHQEKILVFTRFRETLHEVERLARRAGVPAAVVHGGLDRGKKDEAFRRFREEVPLLLCTDVGSEGQNLQFCHVLVNFDLPWNPMVIEQRIGRLHRYGQTEPVRVYNLCSKGTAEERLLDVLDRRVHLFELVIGEMDMVLGNLVDEQDLQERVLSIYARSRDDAQIAAGFDLIAGEMARARGQYEKVRELDQALFGKEFEA